LCIKYIYDLIINFKIFILLVSADSSNKRHYSIRNSPIGKIGAKDIDQDFGQPLSQSYYNKNNYSKFSLENASFETNEFNQGKLNKLQLIINIVILVGRCNIILIVKYLDLMVNFKM